MIVRHASRVHSEVMDPGDTGARGLSPVFDTYRAWVAECSCGWSAHDGVAVLTYRTRDRARQVFRAHLDWEGHPDRVLTMQECRSRR